MKKTLLPLAITAALVGLAFSSSSRACTDFDANPTGKKLLNVKGLDANSEHGGDSGGAPAAVEKVILNGDGVAVAKAMIFVGTGEDGYHARNLARAAVKQFAEASKRDSRRQRHPRQ